MRFEEYVAARYGRLIEHAVLLGCAEGEAGTYVDKVLLEQKKKIRRSGDPDPLVHAALERAINGQREESRSTGPFVALALRTVVALPLAIPDHVLGVLYMDRADPEPVLADRDLVLLHALATAAASAIFRAREAADPED